MLPRVETVIDQFETDKRPKNISGEKAKRLLLSYFLTTF